MYSNVSRYVFVIPNGLYYGTFQEEEDEVHKYKESVNNANWNRLKEIVSVGYWINCSFVAKKKKLRCGTAKTSTKRLTKDIILLLVKKSAAILCLNR